MSLCSVYSKEGKAKRTVHIPSVIRHSPIRPDVVHFVHTNLSKNHRQPYGRYNKAGHQHSAESWGTGRAVARVPRVSGSGTGRNGQAAFANMTRSGRMYSPHKIWRRWHRMVNVTQKRYAMCSAIAASSVPALVMAHGHRIERVSEIPLVVESKAERIKKTKEAVALLKALHATNDVKRSADSRKIRAGQGKMRNRRYVQRKGVLIVHAKKQGLTRAMRNISGVNCINVNRLNIREMAPGGHVGRFIIWTEAAFKKLDQLYGSRKRDALLKKGYRHPHSHMTLTDLSRIIHSSTVAKVIKPRRRPRARIPKKRGELLLVRKIRRHTILNSKAKQARQARLEKLRAAGKLPAKKEKGPVTKRPTLKDPFGLPLRRKERREVLRKLKAVGKERKALLKKKRLERIQKAIADAKAKRAENRKKLAELKRPKLTKKRKPASKAEKLKEKAEKKKAKLAELAKSKALKQSAANAASQKKAAARKAKEAKKPKKTVEPKPKKTVTEKPKKTVTEKPKKTVTEKPKKTVTEKPKKPVTEKPKKTQKPKETQKPKTVSKKPASSPKQ